MMRHPTHEDALYRLAAHRLHGEPSITIEAHGAVERVEGGAFVEARIWVPQAAIDDLEQERAFHERAVPATRL